MEKKKFAIEKKWIAVIALGAVLLALIVVLVVVIVNSKKAENAQAGIAYAVVTTDENGNSTVRIITDANEPLPADAIMGYFVDGNYQPVTEQMERIPDNAELVYADPVTHPDSPTAPPQETMTPSDATPAPANTTAPSETTAPTDDPNSQVGLPDDSNWASDDWDDSNAIVVDFNDLFGTPEP